MSRECREAARGVIIEGLADRTIIGPSMVPRSDE
jgi:hypothetical protein